MQALAEPHPQHSLLNINFERHNDWPWSIQSEGKIINNTGIIINIITLKYKKNLLKFFNISTKNQFKTININQILKYKN